MSRNSCDLGKSILDDRGERLISSQPTREDFVNALEVYLTTMQERCPDVIHPNMEFLTNSFLLITLSSSLSVTKPPGQETLEDTLRDVVRYKMQAISQPLAQVQKRLGEHCSHHTVIEFNSRQNQVS